MLELALDSAPYATAAYLQFRVITSIVHPDRAARGGWLCVLLPWACR